jgi:phage terminase small subunit
MPLIKKYRDREIKLKELLHEFHDLTFEDQMSKLEFYCTEFGVYTSDQEASDYGKVPEPEIQEVQSASFLSFREILNY